MYFLEPHFQRGQRHRGENQDGKRRSPRRKKSGSVTASPAAQYYRIPATVINQPSGMTRTVKNTFADLCYCCNHQMPGVRRSCTAANTRAIRTDRTTLFWSVPYKMKISLSPTKKKSSTTPSVATCDLAKMFQQIGENRHKFMINGAQDLSQWLVCPAWK